MSWTIHSEYPVGTAFGACFKCRAALRRGERVIEPNLPTHDMPPELVSGQEDGWLCFCESCITEAAQMLGMVTGAQTAKLEQFLDRAREDAKFWKGQADTAETALEALRRYDGKKFKAADAG
jgi:hypothetical protein